MFSKAFSSGLLKVRIVWYRDNPLHSDNMKTFTVKNMNVTQKLKFTYGKVETLVEKEKMSVTSIFSYFQNIL